MVFDYSFVGILSFKILLLISEFISVYDIYILHALLEHCILHASNDVASLSNTLNILAYVLLRIMVTVYLLLYWNIKLISMKKIIIPHISMKIAVLTEEKFVFRCEVNEMRLELKSWPQILCNK